MKINCLNIIPLPRQYSISSSRINHNHNIVYIDAKLPPQAYQLQITPACINIFSSSPAGKYYAHNTLKQLILQYNDNLPCLEISDQPNFTYRGIHLDVSRHFFPVSTIKKLLAAMGYYKLNKFHWHLNDDQGWRIHLKKYPELSRISAFRKEKDGSSYGGFYTQDEIKEVIDFAAQHHIEVIPEIELPGHSRAVFAACPQFSCRQKFLPVTSQWGVFEDVYCPGNDQTLIFLKNVLSEVAELFPSKYIHIGGDECPTDRWQQCPACQNKMKELQLDSERKLQEWFINQISQFLISLGKIPIGWDEVISDGLHKDMTIMAWRGDGKEALQLALKAHRKVIMTPNFFCYFDWKQTSLPQEKGAFGLTPLSKVYNYNPLENITDDQQLLMGLQGNIWTEQISSEKDLFYMAFPRALAIAEIAWSNQAKDFNDFKKRVIAQQNFLTKSGITPCQYIE